MNPSHFPGASQFYTLAFLRGVEPLGLSLCWLMFLQKRDAPHFPLYYLFNALRCQGWPLGIDDYLAAVQLIEQGVVIGNSKKHRELEQLCAWLWAKSPQQQETIQQLCEQIRTTHTIKLPQEKEILDRSLPSKKSPSSKLKKTPPPLPPRRFLPQPDYSQNLDKEPQEVAQFILSEQSQPEDRDLPLPATYRFLREYFPVTQRQMKQSWRSLRRLVREGKPEEIDIEGTIQKISQEGILSQLVLRPKRINRADLILFVDQQGSMVPFHTLSQQLVETAQRGGKLRRADVYYFYNCPKEVLFTQQTLFGRKSLDETLLSLDNRAVALIISDGGAAREHKDEDRIKATEIFLKKLKQSVRYCAWLNPMPPDTWELTSADRFAQLIPMYSLDRQGLNGAISVLRGRSIPSLLKEN